MSNLRISDNGQWELEGLEKMAYVSSGPVSDSDYFNYVTNHKPISGEVLTSTKKVKGKGGETLYHHTLISKKDFTQISNGEVPERYDVHHILSKHKDFEKLKEKGGVAAGMTDVRKSLTVPTAQGAYSGNNLAVVLGIRVGDGAQGKGYGEQLFHNMIHHHGTLVGDYQYSDVGRKLLDKVKQHSAYHYIPDTIQSFEDATEKGATRCVFSLKDPSKAGVIPDTNIGAQPMGVAPKAVKSKNINKRLK